MDFRLGIFEVVLIILFLVASGMTIITVHFMCKYIRRWW